MAEGRRFGRVDFGALLAELMKFGLVGTVAFFVDLIVYNALVFTVMGDDPIGAKIIAVFLATIVSWVGSRYWTFKAGATHSVPREFAWFVLISAGGLVLSAGCLYVSHYVLGMTSKLADNISANVVGLAIGNVFRYLMYKLLLYKTPSRRVASSGKLSGSASRAGKA